MLDVKPQLLLDTQTSFPLLLNDPKWLPLGIKQKWLQLVLTANVEKENPLGAVIRLYDVDRSDLLAGHVRALLGIDLVTGAVLKDETLPGKLHVQFAGTVDLSILHVNWRVLFFPFIIIIIIIIVFFYKYYYSFKLVPRHVFLRIADYNAMK